MSTVSVLNTDADISGHTLITAEADRTITGNITFSRSPSAPFTVTVGSANVANLDSNFLQGHLASFFQNASNINAGTLGAAFGGAGGVITLVTQGRLTLTSGNAVPVADQLAQGTLYFTPYQGNNISLFDGASTWTTLQFVETSIAVPASTSQVYDVFAFNNSGTMNLELLAWTNDTTRATALVLQSGVLVKTGATTRKYLGTIRTTTVANQCEDSFAKRYVWNYYNRLRRAGRVTEPTDSYPYTTDTYRQANANAANQLDFVIGVAEVLLSVRVASHFSSGSVDQFAIVSIGEDSTTTATVGTIGQGGGTGSSGTGATAPVQTTATLEKYPAVGRHTYVWLERAGGGGTVTWYGDNANAAKWQSGISGWIDG